MTRPRGNLRTRGYAPPVQVSIRLFAGLRERAGTGAAPLELADGATVDDVWPALDLGEEPLASSTRSTSAT